MRVLSPGIGYSPPFRIDLIPVPLAILSGDISADEVRADGDAIRLARLRLRMTVEQVREACGGIGTELSWRQVETGACVVPAGATAVIAAMEAWSAARAG